MKNFLLLMLVFSAWQLKAQNATVAVENKPHTVAERYQLMKGNSQTFQDYKVIKEYILDGVWKITMDSMTNKSTQLANATEKIKQLETSLAKSQSDLKQKEDSMEEIVFASTHIRVLGKSLAKSVFLSVCAITSTILLVVIFLLVAKIKTMQMFVAESKVVVNSITHEFNEYKRNALDKEIKLSRELQTERNKVMELKTQRN